MIKKSTGIVFRSTAYSETSLILDIYTKEYGLVSCIVSGIRKPRARMHANIFQIMNFLDFVFYDKQTSKGLSRIKEAKSAFVYQRVPFAIVRLAIGQFMIEILQKSIREREANSELYTFISESFTSLDTINESELTSFHLRFLIQLTRFLGFYPDNNWSENHTFFDPLAGYFTPGITSGKHTVNEEDSRVISHLLSRVSDATEIQFPKQQRLTLLNHLLFFYKLHVEKFPDIRSFEILKQIFS